MSYKRVDNPKQNGVDYIFPLSSSSIFAVLRRAGWRLWCRFSAVQFEKTNTTT